MATLLDFHEIWGYVAIGMNAIAGVIALAAWRWKSARGKHVWIATIIAEAALLLQVVVGTILEASEDYVAPRIHMFYGFVAFITVGIAYQYRQQMRGRREMFYGLVGLFLMGLGIRALQGELTAMAAKRRVLLLFGGRSAEHDVSRVTAVAVARALDRSRYDVVPVAITTDGRWLLADSAQRAIAAGPAALPSAFPVDGEVAPAVGALDVDVVLPLLHGPYGEDGTVQGLLELADLPYVGSGVVGSAVAMDKVMMKRAFAAAGLPFAHTVEFRDGHDRAALREVVERDVGYPCFVKPANLGSSVGVSKAVDRAAFDTACDLALSYDEWIVVEEAVNGREIELGVLGDDPPLVSVPGEIVPGDDFYSYADKYEADDAELLVPAPLTDDEVTAAQALAGRAFEACRCEAMARVDLFLTGDGHFLVNEVNTIPGFTPISMYPRLWEATGVPYAELLDRLIDLAIARHARRAARAGRQR